MPEITEEEKERLKRLFEEADKVKEQVKQARENPQDLIKLYQDYYQQYLANQQESQQILLDALSKIQNTVTELTTREITELHRNLGIRFNRDGTIAKISGGAPVLKEIIQIITSLIQSPIIYQYYLSLGVALPTKEDLNNILKENTITSLTPIIYNILKSPSMLTPDGIVQKLQYPPPPIPKLLENLETLILPQPSESNHEQINLLFQALYNDLGIKCYITKEGITLQKIKFNSPTLLADWEDKRYNIHFNNTTQYATITSNIPLDDEIRQKKVLGHGAFGKTVKGTDKNLRPIAIKKLSAPIPTSKEAASLTQEKMKVIAKEISALKKLNKGGTAKRTTSKTDSKEVHVRVTMDFYEGKPLNSKDSLNVEFSARINLMEQLVAQIKEAHQAGIRHNDLKGENIIVDYQKLTVGLADFGIIDNITDPKNPPAFESKGTPIYIAPEMVDTDIIENLRASNPNLELSTYFASDIYSLGKVLIYDAGLHTLGIAYKMTNADPTQRPTLDEISAALEKYKEDAARIAQQEKTIEKTTELSIKVELICELYKNHDICSKQYYNTLMQVLESGTPEDLSKMQTIPMFNHLFQVEPIAASKGIYKQQDIPFENKMLELFTRAQQNDNKDKVTSILIKHLCNSLKKPEEIWCTPNNIADILAKSPEVAFFVQHTINNLLTQPDNKAIEPQLLLIKIALDNQSILKKPRLDRPLRSGNSDVQYIDDVPKYLTVEELPPHITVVNIPSGSEDELSSIGYDKHNNSQDSISPTSSTPKSNPTRKVRFNISPTKNEDSNGIKSNQPISPGASKHK